MIFGPLPIKNHTHRERRDGVTIYNFAGKRHNRSMFQWLMRQTFGNGTLVRGTVDSRTGRVTLHRGAKGGVPCR
jgi:hypothetical protein